MAVAIAILLATPIRIKNLRMIEIGRHLSLYGDRMMLSFSENEVKNAVALEFEVVDQDTVELIRWFIERHRPQIASEDSTHLFAGKSGPRTDCGLSAPLMKTLQKGLGLRVNPHLFRHLAAKLFLDTHPGQYETVRQFLGHKSMGTTTRFYAGFETKAAAKLYQDVIAKRRGETVVA